MICLLDPDTKFDCREDFRSLTAVVVEGLEVSISGWSVLRKFRSSTWITPRAWSSEGLTLGGPPSLLVVGETGVNAAEGALGREVVGEENCFWGEGGAVI